MPLQKNLNVAPYYADYNPLSDYYKILFKAGYPVQARELTNSQLMMQNQMETFMSRFLKEGDNVVPGEFGYTNSSYVRVSSITQGSTAAEFQGYTLTGVTSGVTAFVNTATAETTTDDVTFFVSYQSSGTNAEQSTFIEGETLESNTPNRYTAVVGVNNVSKPTNTPPVGLGSVFTVKEGYYFVDGTSVRNDDQIITLDKYGVAPSYAVGFLVIEEFITANEDPVLLDNSQGSSNFAAPGADRLKITLRLQKRGLDDDFTDPNFILLAKIVGGNIEGNPDQTVKWAWLYDILAKRTFDESGDYIVTEFPVQLLEYINTETVNGVANANEDDLYPPVPGSGSTELLTVTEAEGKYVVKLSPGKAYVQGYAAGNSSPAYLYGNKPRTQNFRTDANIQITPGYNIAITSLNSVPDFASINAEIDTLGLETIRVYRNFNDGYVGDAVTTDAQGFEEPYNIGNEPPVTYHCLFEKGGTLGEITGFNVVYEGEIVNGQLKRGNSCVLANPTSGNPPKRGDTIGGLLCTSVQVMNPTPTGLITPRFLTPKAVVTDPQDNPGTLGYNSTYDLGITAASYFTELFLVDNNSTNFEKNWKVGELVFGEQTDSFGVVEAGSVSDRLIVSSITGEFAPGENVYQDEVETDANGNPVPKVSQISREGEVYSFVFTDISSGGTPTSDLADVGSIEVTAINAKITLTKGGGDYIHITATNVLIPTAQGRQKLRNFPYPEGSVLAQRINYTLLTDTGLNGYANQGLGKIQNSVVKAKSFYAPQDSQLVNFTANIAIQSNNDSEIVPLANGSLFSGQAGNNFIKCDDFTGDPAQQVQIGDVIAITDDTGATVNKLVTFATKPVGYGRERDFSYVYFTTTLINAVTSKTASRIRIKKKGNASETLLYQLPASVVASLQSDPLATGINYSVMQEFVVQLAGGTTQVPLATNKQNESFIGNISQTTITVASLPSDASDAQGILGRQLSIGSFSLDNNGREIVFTLNKQIQTPSVLKVMVPVYITNALAKIKTMNRKQVMTITGEAAKRRVLSLGITDGVQVRSIKMAPNDLDIRDNYIFDDGQRDNVYEISRLILKAGAPIATGDLTIEYDYYSHSGDGDFFSVDSYTSDGGVSYGEIPYWRPTKLIPDNNESNAAINIALRDCVDFRPVVNTTGSDPSYLPVITEPGSGVTGDATLSTNFRTASAYDGNGSIPRFPTAGSLFICDIAYYMGRIDSLYLEYGGALRLIQGEQSDSPIAPPPLATGLKLYDFTLPPYTFSVTSIQTKKYNYNRYTMKDIASIDKRVSRVEELVTLSLLEQSALNMQVRDAVTGLSRFKNGIVVDRFSNHALGSVGSSQYRNSIDPKLSQLRAPFYNDQVELIEAAQTDEQRSGLGYRRSGPYFTVDFTSLRFMQNPFATRTINLQPYSVFTYDGAVELTPSVDTFQDITTLPDLVIEDNDIYNAMTNLTDEMAAAGMGTVWGDWETTGNVTKERNRFRLGGHPSTITDEQQAAYLAMLEAQGVEVSQGKISEKRRKRFERKGWNPPIRVTDVTTKTELQREQIATTINVSTGSVKDTSYGERVTDVALANTCRSIPVRVQAGRLKPNTKYYIFFDDIDCSEWFSVDTIQTDYSDGQGRYAGQPGSTQRGFGAPIISDDIGKLTGLFLLPNGRAPVAGSVFTNLQSVRYQGSGSTRSFNTGTRKFRITSSELNAQDLEIVEGFAETSFTSSGVLLDKQETIVSTRLPEFAFSKEVVDTETRWEESTKRKASYFDPVAQTFLIDNNHPEGLMVTELDVFFKTKDKIEAVEAYLTPTNGQVPTEQIIPFSRVVLESDSILRVIVTGVSTSNVTIPAGTVIEGNVSGASGVVKSSQTFDSAANNSATNITNTTYNLILDNYNGIFVPGEVLTTGDANYTITVASDTFEIEDVRLTALGSGYTDPTVTFTSPQLPGGVTATGTVKASTTATGQVIYEVTITDKGSGYTQVPAVTFSGGSGTGATAEVLVSPGTKAVTMGVCTSDDATAATRFKFPVPVYLLSDTNYSFVLKAPTSLEYTCWTSKLGENEVGTQTRVSQQPNLGSLFKSQNGGLWTEDQTQDIKFILYRAQYDTNLRAQVKLLNAPLKPKLLPLNPIETNADGSDTTSNIFGVNPQVIKIESLYHGLAPNDFVAISGISNDPGGVPIAEINTLHTVLDAGIGYFTVKVTTSATNNERDGGNQAEFTPNKPYEVLNVYTGAMPFASGTLTATNRATQAAGATGYNVLNQYKIDLPNEILLADTYYYNGARQVANQINESKYNGTTQLRGNKSLETQITLATINNEVSPVVDFDRTNANLIRNLIDNPIADDSAVGARTAIVSLKSRTSDLSLPVGNKFSYTNGGVLYDAFVKSYNATTGKIRLIGNNLNKLVGATFSNSVVQSIGADITTTNGMLFKPETSPDGSVYSKWLSRQFLFEDPCDGMELKLTVVQYEKTSIRAYYRARAIGFEGDITQENWTPFNPEQTLDITNASGQVSPVVYPGLPDNINNVSVRSSLDVDPRELGPADYLSITFTEQDVPAFDAIEIKIVMTAENPANAPLVDDMILVCSE